jgi:lipopolysaccharide/colanic/teichoic acid biosynthesis glycosyltransferase
MQAAQLKLSSDLAVLGTPSDDVRGARVLTSELTVDIPTIQFADVAFAVTRDESAQPRERDEFAARLLNVTIAVLALVLLAPLILLVALAIKLTSRGPVLYSQIRVGVDRRWRFARMFDRRVYDHGGKLFTMYKFRTMQVNAEPDGRPVWASKGDPRVTLIGRFLRSTRLDELPQLWNVIRGEMNVVGPRPERPAIFAELRKTIPEYPLRQRVRPGITGWAQVNQAYDCCIDDVRSKVRFDLEYVRRQSVFEDLRIMSMTLPVMVFRRGAQ